LSSPKLKQRGEKNKSKRAGAGEGREGLDRARHKKREEKGEGRKDLLYIDSREKKSLAVQLFLGGGIGDARLQREEKRKTDEKNGFFLE